MIAAGSTASGGRSRSKRNFEEGRCFLRPSVSSSAEWPSGWAEHRSIPLDQLISEANEYASLPIVVEDPKIAKRDVSGRFKISDTEIFLQRIADLFDLTIHRRPDGIYLRSQ